MDAQAIDAKAKFSRPEGAQCVWLSTSGSAVPYLPLFQEVPH